MNEIEMDELERMKIFFERPEAKDTVYAFSFRSGSNVKGDEVLSIERTPVKSKALSSSGNYFCLESLEQILFIAHLFECWGKGKKECVCN